MVCAGFTRNLFTKSTRFANYLPCGVYQGEKLKELWENMISSPCFYKPGISTYVWNKLFRRNIVIGPQSRVDNRINIGEDAAVTYPALLSCERVAVIDNADYHYRQREDSMLKQSDDYAAEAQKLLYLYRYLDDWAGNTPAGFHIAEQVREYILSIAVIRSGGHLPHDDFSVFDRSYYGKKVVIYSAGTFGQQLVRRFRETKHCELVAWIDDDFWEYRRCCLDVDPVESVSDLNYDYILIATVDGALGEDIKKRLTGSGVDIDKILTVSITEEKEQLVERFLDIDKIMEERANRKKEVMTHA